MQWPPLPDLDPTGTQPDDPNKKGSCHFLFTGREEIIEGTKKFVPEHMDGPLINKRNNKFQDQKGNIYAFIDADSTSASEMERMEYCGSASDNNLPVGPPLKSTRQILKEERQENAKLQKLLLDSNGINRLLEVATVAETAVASPTTGISLRPPPQLQLSTGAVAATPTGTNRKRKSELQKLLLDQNGINLLLQAATVVDTAEASPTTGMSLRPRPHLPTGATPTGANRKYYDLHVEPPKKKQREILKENIEEKAKLHKLSVDRNGNSLLHQAVLKNDITDVTMCLESNSFDLEANNKMKETALHCAARTGNVKVVRLLLEKGAKLEPRYILGETPIFIAIRCGHEKVVEQLIISGADLEARNNRQKTLLHVASSRRNTKIVQLLLEKNPNLLEAKDEYGETPLSYAIKHQDEQVVEQLITSGADLEAICPILKKIYKNHYSCMSL